MLTGYFIRDVYMLWLIILLRGTLARPGRRRNLGSACVAWCQGGFTLTLHLLLTSYLDTSMNQPYWYGLISIQRMVITCNAKVVGELNWPRSRFVWYTYYSPIQSCQRVWGDIPNYWPLQDGFLNQRRACLGEFTVTGSIRDIRLIP